MGKGPQSIKANYRVSSAGSILVETIFGGTPNEMITIYRDDKNQRLGLTHYCGLNNQSKMVLIKDKRNALAFDLAPDGTPIDAAHEPHMHAITLLHRKGWDATTLDSICPGRKEKTVEITFKRTL